MHVRPRQIPAIPHYHIVPSFKAEFQESNNLAGLLLDSIKPKLNTEDPSYRLRRPIQTGQCKQCYNQINRIGHTRGLLRGWNDFAAINGGMPIEFRQVVNRPSDDFGPVFRVHVQLYVLADKYVIESLLHAVLYKMHRTLTDYSMYSTAVGAFIELIRKVYASTVEFETNIGAMRDLVTRHAVFFQDKISYTPLFEELLAEGGAFVVDFWHLVWRGPH